MAAAKKTTRKKTTAKKTAKKATAVKKVTAKKSTTSKKKTTNKTNKKTTKVTKRKATMKAIEEKALTTDEIEQFRNVLWEKRMELLGDVNHMSEGALENNQQDSAGELSSMPIHMADLGTDNYEKEFTIGLIESDRKLLKDIDHALTKVKEGTYGVCEVTGKFIGRARLTAKPEARYHIEFAQKLEQGLVEPPDENGNIDLHKTSE